MISPATPGTKLTEAGAGRPAVLLCFVPASFEVLGMVLLGATADREVYQVRQLLEKRILSQMDMLRNK